MKLLNKIKIIKNQIIVDDNKIFSEKDVSFKEFSKIIYKKLNIKYPKFFKMDNLSKLAILTTEILLNNFDLKIYKPDEVAVILANSSSSLNTDVNYQKLLMKYLVLHCLFILYQMLQYMPLYHNCLAYNMSLQQNLHNRHLLAR